MERNFTYNLLDNFIGYDDGLMTPGERLGASINRLATGLYEDPIGMVGAVARDTVGDLNYLMFQGGAEREPERVFGYAAAPMAPGALRGRVANVVSAGGAKPKKGITAYHGSPHDFDRFSMDKIGTGEGAQAYGHGLYFAENEAVAKGYRDALSGSMARNANSMNPSDIAFGAMRQFNGNRNSAADWLEQNLMDVDLGDSVPRYQDAIKILRSDQKISAPGSMYEVRINADPDDFLDWDAPLSAQPGVASKIKSDPNIGFLADQYADHPEPMRGLEYNIGARGDLFDDTSNFQRNAAAKMQELGIPGIKYRDAGSRGLDGQSGTRNFVVFDENLIEIVRKYGIAGAAAMLGISAQELQAQIGGDQ